MAAADDHQPVGKPEPVQYFRQACSCGVLYVSESKKTLKGQLDRHRDQKSRQERGGFGS